MRYLALASDYDGTLAHDGVLADSTRAALERFRNTGRKIILVTGREIDDLERVCPDLAGFDLVVAENGGVLYTPATRELAVLVEPPPPVFADTLEARGVPAVRRGHVVVATWQPHETTVLQVIRELGLEMQVIFNKGAVMILPSGVNKGSGLRAALASLRLSPHNVVAIGDAENDHALLDACECRAAVANALPMLKERADLVTESDHGAGVVELIERVMVNDLVDLGWTSMRRHDLRLGTRAPGEDSPGGAEAAEVSLPAYGVNVLLAGTSGGGKSTFTTAFLEQLQERSYQYCVFDPEGDYGEMPGAVLLGGPQERPDIDAVIKVLDEPRQNAVINLLGVGLAERPVLFDAFLPRLHLERSRTGHPHWIVIDEAHHLAPQEGAGTPPVPTGQMCNLFLITVQPAHVAPALLGAMDVVVAIGAAPAQTFADFARAVGLPPPAVADRPLESGQAIVWWPHRNDTPPVRIETTQPQTERRRHIRKYAEGELPPERSFFFHGPAGKLNLRAQNLISFMQLGDGVDDDTWNHHLRLGDYSRWLGDVIKDRELAAEVAAVERQRADRPAAETRATVRAAIEKRYTGPT